MDALYIRNVLSTEVVERSKNGKKQVVRLLVEYNNGSTAQMWRIDRLYPDGGILESELFSFPLTL